MLTRRFRRSTAGRIMIGIAAVGVVVALVGTVIAWQLAGEVGDTLDETLEVTVASLGTVTDTIAVADVVVADVATGLADLDDAITQVEQGLGDAQPLLADLQRLTADVPDAIVRFQDALDAVAGAAAPIDRALTQLGSLPFGPDIDPEETLSGRLGALSAQLDPVVESLRSSSGSLEALSDRTGGLRQDLQSLAGNVGSISATLDESSRLVAEYHQQAERAGELATESRRDLDGRIALMRLLIVIGGLALAASQFVPLWIGLELIDRSDGGPGNAHGGSGESGQQNLPMTTRRFR